MAKKKKKDEINVVGRLGTNGEIAPYNEARVLGRIDDNGNRTAFIQAQKEEIAPTKDTWLKKGALDDSGVAYTGTLDKINRFNAGLLLSAVDALGNVGLGITKPVEGIGDFAQSRFADIQDYLGFDEAAEKTRKSAAGEWKVNKELETLLASDNGMGVNDLSYLGTKGKGVAQGLGSVLLASASGGLGQIVGGTGAVANVASLGTMGVGAAGNAEQEALEQGATRKEARMYGLISGVGETLSEMMFGGLSKGSQVLGIGTGIFDSVDDAVASGLTKKIENKIAKNLIEAGVKATSEGVEEVMSGVFEAASKKLTYMKDEDIRKLIEDENLLDSFLSGAISAGISQAPGYVQSITTTENGKLRLQNQNEIRDYISNLNQQEQQVVEREIENRLGQEEKVSNKRRIEIEKQVIEDLDRGYINANTIRDVLGENYNAERDTRLNESFNEETRRTQAYENDLSKYDEKQRKTIQTAIDSGLLNNSNKTHDFVDLIAKISADKGVDFDFTNNERIKDTGFAVEGKTVNGFVQDGKVTLNLESNQALNKTVGHEITHVLEGTELYNSLQDSLKSFIGEREWNNRISELEKNYKNVKGANIENELTSDLVGEYVFNDESFVRSLSTKNPNLFQKIFDEIKYMVKIATAGSKEARDLEKVKRAFEKAYREASKIQEGTQYSIKDNNNRELSKEQQTYFKDSKIRNENGELEVVYHTSPNQFTLFDSERAGENTGYDNTAFGSFVTTNRNFSERFGDINEEGTKGNTMEMYANITNPITHPYNAEYKYSGEQLDNIVENWFNAIDETEALEELKSYVEDGEYDSLYQAYRNTVEFSDESPFEYASDEKKKLQEKGYDGVEFVEGLDKDVNYNVSDSNEPVSSYAVFDSNQLKNIDNSKPTSNPDIRYSLSVEEANTTQDNEGRKLTDNQLAYFKDSKAVDENGNLITVYHTTTEKVAQFNEFNPTGTDYYKFGDQVVNYFTDDKNMSGSYADQHYEMADTKRVETIEEAKDLISNYNTKNETSFEIANNTDGTMSIVDNTYANALTRMRELWENEFSPEEKARLKEYGEQMEGYIKSGYDNNLYPDFGSLDKVLPDISKKIDDIENNLKHYERDIFAHIRTNPDGEIPSYIQTEPVYVGTYNTENELLKNIKSDLQKSNYDSRNRLQYEGYANITNPYIIDAEGRTWNKVESKADSDFTKELMKVTPEDRQFLESLASDSIKTYNDNLFNYQQAERAVNDFAVDRTNTTLEQRLVHRTIHDLGFEEFMKILNNEQVFWGHKEQFMDDMFNNGISSYQEKREFNKTGKIPPQVLEKVNKLIHDPARYEDRYMKRELEALNMPPEIKTTTIYDLWNNQQEAYKTFDEGGRYEYSKFNNVVNEKNLYRALDNEALFKIAKRGFTDENIRLLYNDWSVTNDIVKSIIELNKVGENYDGVIIRNVIDYGGESEVHEPHDLYITFNSNQFKAVDNLNPTDDADIRYQLGQQRDTNGWNVRSEDVRLQSAFNNAIAPLQEQVQQLNDTITRLEDRIAPLNEQEADELYQETQRGFENEAAPIRENLTPEENHRMDMLELLERNNMMNEERRYEKEQLEAKQNIVDEEISPARSLEEVRSIKEAGKRNVKAYQYEHPEVKPYFQEEARKMLGELDDSIKADRYSIPDRSWSDAAERTTWTGNKRVTSPNIAALLDGDLGYKYSYDEIRKGLNAIIEDHGAENIAVAKRIEFILDERLRDGYDVWAYGEIMKNENGEEMRIPPNQEYLNMLKEQEWENYFEDINAQYPFEENIPQYNLENEETDFSDVEINPEPFMNYIENSSELAKERQGLRNELNQKKEVFIPKEKSSFRNTVDTLKALFTNKNVEIDNLARESGNQNIKYAGDMVNNTAAEAISNIENAQTNNEGKAIGRSLRSIFNEAREQGLEEALNDYLLNWSNIDRHKQGKGSNISSEDSYKLVKQYEEKYPELKEMAKDVWQYSRNARHNLRDAGIINQDVSDMLGRMYPHYVPYISDGNDSYFVDMGELKPRQAIKRAKGGAIQETLLPVEEALTRYTYAQKKAVRQNELYREIVKTIGDNVMIGGDVRTDYTNMADSLYRDRNGNYLTAYENGEQITTRISDNLYKSLSNELENNVKDIEQKLSFITKPLQKISQIRRDILTKWSPTFPVTNAMKDVQDAVLNTKYTQDFIKNYPSAFKELATNTELAAQFKSLYGSGTAMGQYDVDSGLYKANKGAKNANFLNNLANKVEGWNNLAELAPRYAEFKASLDNGASIQEAMYNAREVTTNFSRGGVITKALNRNGFTFLNASVQGLSKFIRNFSGENGARGITNSLIKATIFGVAPAVFNELAFGSGDDKDEEYEALPDYIKDNYYLIKLNNGTFIRLPKGRMLSVFGSAARRTLEVMQGEEDAFEGFLQNVNSQIGVNNPEENNIFSPLIQAYGTKNGTAWYGGDIVPTRLQNVPKGEQYDASTDRLSIFLGEKLGISPYKLNYVLDQYTGGIGDIFLPMMTQEASSDGSLLAPIKDKFTADSTSDNKYVSDFYTKNDELKINANSSKATDEDKLKQKYMSSISSEMAELYKERREIQSSDLPKSTKYKKAQSIKDEINRLAKEGLDNYNNVIVEGNYAQIGDNEYYKNANGEWTKAKDETKELGLNPQEKSEYYNTKSVISETKKNNDGNDKPLVIQDIVNSNLTPEAKANLYTSNYKDDLINPMVDLGVDVDSYLTYKSQNFTADKDSNGKSISGSKKRKVFDYINSMNIPYEQKLILAKSEYNSFNDNNIEILEYINNSDMSYDEKMTLITKLGFKVDGNNVSW